MEEKMEFKYLISVIEGSLFVLLIIFSILTIFDIISIEFSSPNAIFSLWSLRLMVIFVILLLIFPSLLVYFKKVGEKAVVRYNQQVFKNSFIEDIKDLDFINILDIARTFNVNLIYVKNHLREQIAQGNLKGELKDDVFYIKEGFKIMDSKERRFEFMKENLETFLKPHRLIKIREISNNFKIPKSVVKTHFLNLINKGILRGFMEGDTFVRSSSIPEVFLDDIECPHCNKKINLKDLEASEKIT